ncbi:SAM-dependent methyltransferase [Nocardiopsis arvandica]|uniref:SAM-dependent methyltransferase n=1 Tax=Nocardiopsis sinuspersici TaxID=501010 RepID=A0A7Y9XIN8_9ACTN|nr:class I SAM-dependent methyltransferase [Nocardiopsis sinuspersici]NYH55160.1 SAM-dependent methyltransferase [Nocardiopsis sinuspersici]
MHPADFYTGIVADLYGPLKRFSPDPEPYAAFVREAGGPGLELGCGDGDPLIELRRRGLDVEGVDSSADMLARCRSRAAEEGIDVLVHHQRMEALDLPRRYGAVFLAGPTFTLLPDDGAALAALRGVRAHLAQGGTALMPLFVPEPTPAGQIGRVRVTTADDGAELRVSVVSEERDEAARTQVTTLRYERHRGGEGTVEDRPWLVHWYTREGFEALAGAAGLRAVSVTGADGGPAADGATDVRFRFRAT